MQFKHLQVWKRSSRLSVELYKYSTKIKNFGFRDQITRAALSIPSNTAQGEDRDSIKESMRYINIAKGSSAEVITQMYIGIEANIIDRTKGLNWIRELEEINKMLGGLLKKKRSLLNSKL